MSGYRRPTTPEQRAKAADEREKKLQALHTRLDEQVRTLRSGEDWRRWLVVAARFHQYSFQNTLLILNQRPDASAVAGYEAWRGMDRQVSKGEKGIAILAPIVRRLPDADKQDDEAREPRIVGYQPAYVWDVAQTTGQPLPAQPAPALLVGQAPDGFWDKLANLAQDAGYSIERGDCGSANGWTHPASRTIRINSDLDDAHAVKTLAHELGHVRLHADAADQIGCRGIIEVEAESFAYLVTAATGLDSGGFTFPYIAHWAHNTGLPTREEVVRQTGNRVLGAARWALDALWPQQPATDDQQLAERVDTALSTTAALRARAEAGHSEASRVATQPAPRALDREVSRAELLDLHRMASAFYQAHLPGSWVPDYLESRSLETALADPWRAGHAPAGWTPLVDHLRDAGADDPALLASGLAMTARTGNLIDRFRDRLMIPLRDDRSDIVAFIGRASPDAGDRTPKYLNSPQTQIYNKGNLLYGLPETVGRLQRGAVPVLVEGPLDAIAVTTGTGGRCAGLALCGTALTEEHVQRLAENANLRRRLLIVAMDADKAGRRAAEDALQLLLPYEVSLRAAALNSGNDPADALAALGPAELTGALLDRSHPLADVVLDHRLSTWNGQLTWLEERVHVLREVAPLVAQLSRDDVSRLCGRLAHRLDLDVSTVQREVASYIGRPPQTRATRPARSPARPLVTAPSPPTRRAR